MVFGLYLEMISPEMNQSTFVNVSSEDKNSKDQERYADWEIDEFETPGYIFKMAPSSSSKNRRQKKLSFDSDSDSDKENTVNEVING